MTKQLSADGAPDEPLPITDPDDTGIPQQRVTRRPNTTTKEHDMSEPTEVSWHRMSQNELIAQVKMWRARSLQNRAELREAQSHLERLGHAHKNACADARKYRQRAQTAESKLKGADDE